MQEVYIFIFIFNLKIKEINQKNENAKKKVPTYLLQIIGENVLRYCVHCKTVR